jgi:hypothetical protein
MLCVWRGWGKQANKFITMDKWFDNPKVQDKYFSSKSFGGFLIKTKTVFFSSG